MYFQYGQEETEYLSGKDEKLGAVIAQVGRVNRQSVLSPQEGISLTLR